MYFAISLFTGATFSIALAWLNTTNFKPFPKEPFLDRMAFCGLISFLAGIIWPISLPIGIFGVIAVASELFLRKVNK